MVRRLQVSRTHSPERRKEPLELIEIDVHEAYDALGEIIGEAVAGDVVDQVFARFCLGK